MKDNNNNKKRGKQYNEMKVYIWPKIKVKRPDKNFKHIKGCCEKNDQMGRISEIRSRKMKWAQIKNWNG
jgi:hypothetical protein